MRRCYLKLWTLIERRGTKSAPTGGKILYAFNSIDRIIFQINEKTLPARRCRCTGTINRVNPLAGIQNVQELSTAFGTVCHKTEVKSL